MRRIMFCALLSLATLFFGGAEAGEAVILDQLAAKATCKKKVDGKCVKPSSKHKAKKAKKKKAKPLAKVSPRIPKNYTPPPRTGKRMTDIIAAYKSCMYGDGDRLQNALERNFANRDTPELGGSPEKLGNEVCLADALGLKRYETLADIEAAKGTELVEVFASPVLIISDQLPDERRFARPWVRDYLVALSRAMEAHFAKEEGGGDFTPLRVTSLVRSYKDQRRQKNSPASCRSEICSTHTTGATVDISNNFFYLGRKERQGKIIMIQESFPPHFHVLVLPPEFVPETEE